MNTKSHLTVSEGTKIIDSHFEKLEASIISAMKEAGIIQNLMLKTADDINLFFPDDIQEPEQITVGTGPVKLEDGKTAVGDFTMPDGRILTIDSKGYITKIKEPSTEEIADSIRKTMTDLRNQVKALKATKGRKPSRPAGKG